MKQAVLIIAHNNWSILKRQIDFFSGDLYDIYIHIDKKSIKSCNTFFSDREDISNIKFLSKYKVNWGGFSQIQTELFLFETAKKMNIKYTYYHLISGVDIPLKSANDIFNFFDVNYPSNFITFSHLEKNKYDNKAHLIEELLNTNSEIFIERINYHYIGHDFQLFNLGIIGRKLAVISSILQKLFRLRRLKDKRILIAKGSNWVSITDEFIDLLLKNKREIYNIFRNSYCADEIYKQTIFVNSNIIDTLYFDKESLYCSNKREIDWVRGSPYVFRDSDLKELVINKNNNLFVRKTSENNSSAVIEKFLTSKNNLNVG